MDEPQDELIGHPGLHPKGIARRQQILDRAIEIYRERGVDGTSLRRIAEELGVSHAALLHYFDSRDQLMLAVYANAERQRAESDDTYRTGIDSIINASVVNVEVPGLVQLYSTLLASSLEGDENSSRPFFEKRFERLRARLTEDIRREQDAGTMRDDVPAADLAALLVGASDGLQLQWLLDRSVGLESTLRTLVALMRASA